MLKTQICVTHPQRVNVFEKPTVESSWNVNAHGDAREEKWRENKRLEWVTIKRHTTAEHRLARAVQTLQADVHSPPASSRLNWRPRRFKWTRPFPRKTKSGFCACAITFQTQSTHLQDRSLLGHHSSEEGVLYHRATAAYNGLSQTASSKTPTQCCVPSRKQDISFAIHYWQHPASYTTACLSNVQIFVKIRLVIHKKYTLAQPYIFQGQRTWSCIGMWTLPFKCRLPVWRSHYERTNFQRRNAARSSQRGNCGPHTTCGPLTLLIWTYMQVYLEHYCVGVWGDM